MSTNNNVLIHWGGLIWRMLPPCYWLQHSANTDTSKMQVTIEEAQGAQSLKTFLLLREISSDGTDVLIKMHDCYRQTYFNYFEYKIWKIPCIYVLICWKFECKQSQLPNDKKWTRDPDVLLGPAVLLLADGKIQLQLWLDLPKYNIRFLNLIIWTWSATLIQGISRVTQPDYYWLGKPNWSRVKLHTQDYR